MVEKYAEEGSKQQSTVLLHGITNSENITLHEQLSRLKSNLEKETNDQNNYFQPFS
jgi:hypothetical protein